MEFYASPIAIHARATNRRMGKRMLPLVLIAPRPSTRRMIETDVSMSVLLTGPLWSIEKKSVRDPGTLPEETRLDSKII
jgi:hypothetical protein